MAIFLHAHPWLPDNFEPTGPIRGMNHRDPNGISLPYTPPLGRSYTIDMNLLPDHSIFIARRRAYLDGEVLSVFQALDEGGHLLEFCQFLMTELTRLTGVLSQEEGLSGMTGLQHLLEYVNATNDVTPYFRDPKYSTTPVRLEMFKKILFWHIALVSAFSRELSGAFPDTLQKLAVQFTLEQHHSAIPRLERSVRTQSLEVLEAPENPYFSRFADDFYQYLIDRRFYTVYASDTALLGLWEESSTGRDQVQRYRMFLEEEALKLRITSFLLASVHQDPSEIDQRGKELKTYLIDRYTSTFQSHSYSASEPYRLSQHLRQYLQLDHHVTPSHF